MILNIATAVILNSLNAIISLIYIKWIMKKKWQTFMELFYLMVVLRFIVSLGLMFWFFKFLKFDIFVFSITFILSYFVLLMIEILYINKRFSTKNYNKSEINKGM